MQFGAGDQVLIAGTSRDPARLLKFTGDQVGTAPGLEAIRPASINDGPPLLFATRDNGGNDLLLTGGGARALPGGGSGNTSRGSI